MMLLDRISSEDTHIEDYLHNQGPNPRLSMVRGSCMAVVCGSVQKLPEDCSLTQCRSLEPLLPSAFL